MTVPTTIDAGAWFSNYLTSEDAEDVDGVVRADDGVPVRDEHGVYLADAVERPVAVLDDVLVTEVLVCGEVGGHGCVALDRFV